MSTEKIADVLETDIHTVKSWLDAAGIARVCKIIRDGKEVVCDELKWKALFRLWMFLFPIRKWIFRVWFRIRKFIKCSS